MANKKYSAFIGEVYPDDPRSGPALDILSSSDGQLFYILHDKDVKEDGSGEFKKAHIHFVFKPVNPRTLKGFADFIGIPSNYIEPCKSLRASVRYLVHADDPTKYQYSLEELQVGGVSTQTDVLEFMADPEKKLTDDEMAFAIFEYITEFGKGVTVTHVTMWALSKGFYSAFRRSFAVFSSIIREVNAI